MHRASGEFVNQHVGNCRRAIVFYNTQNHMLKFYMVYKDQINVQFSVNSHIGPGEKISETHYLRKFKPQEITDEILGGQQEVPVLYQKQIDAFSAIADLVWQQVITDKVAIQIICQPGSKPVQMLNFAQQFNGRDYGDLDELLAFLIYASYNPTINNGAETLPEETQDRFLLLVKAIARDLHGDSTSIEKTILDAIQDFNLYECYGLISELRSAQRDSQFIFAKYALSMMSRMEIFGALGRKISLLQGYERSYNRMAFARNSGQSQDKQVPSTVTASPCFFSKMPLGQVVVGSEYNCAESVGVSLS